MRSLFEFWYHDQASWPSCYRLKSLRGVAPSPPPGRSSKAYLILPPSSYVTTQHKPSRKQAPHPSSSCHRPTRNACTASNSAAPSSCMLCTPISTRPSWLSSPSCGTQVLSDHRNLIVCGRIVAFLVRIMMPTERLLANGLLEVFIRGDD